MDEWNDLKNKTDSCAWIDLQDPEWVSRKTDQVALRSKSYSLRA